MELTLAVSGNGQLKGIFMSRFMGRGTWFLVWIPLMAQLVSFSLNRSCSYNITGIGLQLIIF